MLKSIVGFTCLLTDICSTMEKILLSRGVSRVLYLNNTERTLENIKCHLDDAYRDFLVCLFAFFSPAGDGAGPCTDRLSVACKDASSGKRHPAEGARGPTSSNPHRTHPRPRPRPLAYFILLQIRCFFWPTPDVVYCKSQLNAESSTDDQILGVYYHFILAIIAPHASPARQRVQGFNGAFTLSVPLFIILSRCLDIPVNQCHNKSQSAAVPSSPTA
ncbi:hypothetical protein C8R46DRAFT_1356019, partial [Mycena filopes]